MKLADVLEHMAAAFAFAQHERGSPPVNLMRWDRAQPLTRLYEQHVHAKQDQDRGAILRDVAPSDLGAPIHYALLGDSWDERNERTAGYAGTFARQLHLRQLRGVRLPFVSEHHCEAGMVLLSRAGTYSGCVRMCSWHPRERTWITWDQHGPMRWRHDAFGQRMFVLLGAQFSARYEWHVLLGLPNAPRLSLPCSPAEARELFKARELPPGKTRRAALRHWVGQHLRERDSAEPIAVRAHLRGVTEFTFDQLECELVPSAFDREKLAAP